MLSSHLTFLLEAQQPVADLGRLAEHLPYEWIERAVEATGTASIRRRRLPAEQVVWLVIALAMYRHWSISEVLDGLDLARHFPPAAVLGGDGPFPRKPDPAALLHLVARAGVTPDAALMVGDSGIDWRTARAAGTRVCLARYGLGFGSVPLHDLAPADHLIGAPSELLTL